MEIMYMCVDSCHPTFIENIQEKNLADDFETPYESWAFLASHKSC